MKVVTVVGARPQFIKAAPVSRALKATGVREMLVHTGQHFDADMSAVFFDDLDLPAPQDNLGISGGSHGDMTGRMLIAIEPVIARERPDLLLVYGDTNSTMAAALAAAKLQVPVAHVEAGLRSFNRRMPEEINRIVTDHVSSVLFCPTKTAVDQLAREGIVRDVYHVGDVMYDSVLLFLDVARKRSRIMEKLGLEPGGFVVATIHRAENTESAEQLSRCLDLIRAEAEAPIVFPIHPRTREAAARWNLDLSGFVLAPPLGYLDMLMLVDCSASVFTDSGGLQKEAYFLRKPCVTLRDETEWVETVTHGWNRLWNTPAVTPRREIADFGTGDAALQIARICRDWGSRTVRRG